jgi:hypothetical protein
MKLYMKVTEDEYELPLIVTPYVSELAEKCGVTRNSIESEISRYYQGKIKSCRYRRVDVEED